MDGQQNKKEMEHNEYNLPPSSAPPSPGKT